MELQILSSALIWLFVLLAGYVYIPFDVCPLWQKKQICFKTNKYGLPTGVIALKVFVP
jgi:hypothetical protein